MARRPLDPDSGSSQFFIMTADDTSLDGQYAAFGRVTEGIEIAERITQEIEPVDGSGMIRPDERPVIETVRIID